MLLVWIDFGLEMRGLLLHENGSMEKTLGEATKIQSSLSTMFTFEQNFLAIVEK